MKLSSPQRLMFREVTEAWQPLSAFSVRRAFQTAGALEARDLVVMEPRRDDWYVRLSDTWQRMAHLEQVIQNVEGTPAENTKAHKARCDELDDIYSSLRNLEREPKRVTPNPRRKR